MSDADYGGFDHLAEIDEPFWPETSRGSRGILIAGIIGAGLGIACIRIDSLILQVLGALLVVLGGLLIASSVVNFIHYRQGQSWQSVYDEDDDDLDNPDDDISDDY